MHRQSKLSLPLLITLLCLPQLSETIYTPSLPDIATSLGTSAGWVEMTLGIYFLGFAIGVFLWGCLCDAYGRRVCMLSGLVLYILACIGCMGSTSIAALLTWRVVQGLGASVGSVITQTMLRDCYSGTERNQLFSMVAGALSVAPGLGPIIGGALAGYFGWAMNFAFLAAAGILLLTWSLLLLPETCPVGQSGFAFSHIKTQGKRIISDKRVWVHVCLIAACNGLQFGYFGEAPFVFHHLFGYDPAQYGLFGIVVMSVFVLSAILSHRLNRKLSAERIISLGCALSLLGALCTLGQAYFWELGGFASRYWATTSFLSSYGVVFLGVGLIIPNSLSSALAEYRDVLGTAGAWFGLLYYIGISALMGVVSLIHNGTSFPLSLFFVALSLGMCSLWTMAMYTSRLRTNQQKA